MDCIYEDTSDIMDVAHHSLIIIFPSEVALIIHGRCTDSGGGLGGTKAAFTREIQSKNIEHTLLQHARRIISRYSSKTWLRLYLVLGGTDEKGDFVS